MVSVLLWTGLCVFVMVVSSLADRLVLQPSATHQPQSVMTSRPAPTVIKMSSSEATSVPLNAQNGCSNEVVTRRVPPAAAVHSESRMYRSNDKFLVVQTGAAPTGQTAPQG